MSDNLITPTQFTPSEQQKAESPWYRPSPLRILLGTASLLTVLFLWFLFTAKSVSLVFNPISSSVEINGGFTLTLGGIHLLRSGNYSLVANHDGYFPLQIPLTVGSETNQKYTFALKKLPGRVLFETTPRQVLLLVDETAIGITPGQRFKIPAGKHLISASSERYQPKSIEVEITGLNQEQTVSLELLPDWAEVSFSSNPPNAMVSVAGKAIRKTPLSTEILAGEHEIKIKRAGFKTWTGEISVQAGINQTYPKIDLEKADGLILFNSIPSGASVTLNGTYVGDSPLELNIKSGQAHTLDIFKPGYKPLSRQVQLKSGQEKTLKLALAALTGSLLISVLPEDSLLKIDGILQNSANKKVQLSALEHNIEISKEGYAGYKTILTPTPGFVQEVKVKLLTLAAARLARLKPSITTSTGQKLLLFSPDIVKMGASRRQPGRRSNETMRDVTLSRMFYAGTQEVTNAEFRAFAQGHSSGSFEEQELDDDDQPVVRVNWQEAALYCNWLSKKEGLPSFYNSEFGAITGSNRKSTGYRMLTEAEWAWLARNASSDRFPWGRSLPPPDRHGNYADQTAAHLVGRIIFGYKDNYIVASPVATFPPGPRKLYDLSGNVSEWINDFYEIPTSDSVTDPMGPLTGEYHLIRGSSWMHGTVTDLRVSFRDYGSEGRQDLGFRIARFAE
ncbi:MAG: PEGA domain-containing protein [Pseudomonadales bacterium]|nr:PEGA domain-containing protein [Pseudomonadales bacterium]